MGKDYDIFTGDKKARSHEKRLEEEENAYVRNMEAMVGGPALRVNPFTKAQEKRMDQVAQNSGNKASASQRPKSAGTPGFFLTAMQTGTPANRAAEPPGTQRPVPPLLTAIV